MDPVRSRPGRYLGSPVSTGASRFDEVRLGPGATDFDLEPKTKLHQACTGVDVSKDTLDFALTLDGEGFPLRTLSNDKKGHKADWDWQSKENGGAWQLAPSISNGATTFSLNALSGSDKPDSLIEFKAPNGSTGRASLANSVPSCHPTRCIDKP